MCAYSKVKLNEVYASSRGLIIVGSSGPGTRIWFRKNNAPFANFEMPFEPPRGSPAVFLNDGKLLVVGRNGQTIIVGFSSISAGPSLQNVCVLSLNTDASVVCGGPAFFRYTKDLWIQEVVDVGTTDPTSSEVFDIEDELDKLLESIEIINISTESFAISATNKENYWLRNGSRWISRVFNFKPTLYCAHGAWAGGKDIIIEFQSNSFQKHTVIGDVKCISFWKSKLLYVIDGVLNTFEDGKPVSPGHVTSLGQNNEGVYVIADGFLFESSDLQTWHQIELQI